MLWGDVLTQRVVRVIEAAAEDGQVQGQHHAADHTEVDPDTTHPRDGRDVHITRARVGDRPDLDREPPNHSGEQEGHGRGDEGDEDVLPDRETFIDGGRHELVTPPRSGSRRERYRARCKAPDRYLCLLGNRQLPRSPAVSQALYQASDSTGSPSTFATASRLTAPSRKTTGSPPGRCTHAQ